MSRRINIGPVRDRHYLKVDRNGMDTGILIISSQKGESERVFIPDHLYQYVRDAMDMMYKKRPNKENSK
jgi:hypothetical protein